VFVALLKKSHICDTSNKTSDTASCAKDVSCKDQNNAAIRLTTGKDSNFSDTDQSAQRTRLFVEVIDSVHVGMNILHEVCGWLHLQVDHCKHTMVQTCRHANSKRGLTK